MPLVHRFNQRERSTIPYALAPCLLLAACSSAADGSGPSQQPSPPVTVEALVAHQLPRFDTYIGSVRSRSGSEIRSQVTGRITEIVVRAGEEVEEGTVLMRIDQGRQQAMVSRARAATTAAASELQRARADLLALTAQKQAAESRLGFARKQRERVRALFAANNTSREAFERANSDLDNAGAALAAIEAQREAQQAQIARLQAEVQQSRSALDEGEAELAYYNVRAPIAGTLGDVPVRVGVLVTPSTLLTTLEGNELREMYVQVPVDRSPELKPGLELEVVDLHGEVQETLALSFIAPQVDPVTQTVLVKAQVAGDSTLQAGQYARIRLVWERFEGPAGPPSAVRRINTQPFVFVLNDEDTPTVTQRAVALGPLESGRYIVEDGLKLGEKVVVAGVQRLMDGAPVTLQPPPAPQAGPAHARARHGEAP